MKQQRNTRQREVVLQAVQSRKDHPTADQLYLDIVRTYPRISRGTVYRNLKILAESGRIRQIQVPGADRFDLRTEGHHHLLCIRCQQVADVSCPYDTAADRQVARETGFRMIHHSLLFEGICPTCLAREEKSPIS